MPSTRPDRWVVRSLVTTGLGFASLLFLASGAIFWVARYGLGLSVAQTQTAAYLWLVLAGGQTALYLARARGVFWAKPYPGKWLLWASVFDIAVAVVMANQGWLMHPLSVAWMASLFGVAVAYLVVGNAFRLGASTVIRRVAPARAARTGS